MNRLRSRKATHVTLRKTSWLILLLISPLVCIAAADNATYNGEWLERVPAGDHAHKNPLRRNSTATAEGARTFRAHCVQCHGKHGEGSDHAPTLASSRVRHATDGDLHWLLVNGNRDRGMPPWSKLGDPQLWQLITYIRSLHPHRE